MRSGGSFVTEFVADTNGKDGVATADQGAEGDRAFAEASGKIIVAVVFEVAEMNDLLVARREALHASVERFILRFPERLLSVDGQFLAEELSGTGAEGKGLARFAEQHGTGDVAGDGGGPGPEGPRWIVLTPGGGNRDDRLGEGVMNEGGVALDDGDDGAEEDGFESQGGVDRVFVQVGESRGHIDESLLSTYVFF